MKTTEQVTTNGRAVFYAVLWSDFRKAALELGWALALHGTGHTRWMNATCAFGLCKYLFLLHALPLQCRLVCKLPKRLQQTHPFLIQHISLPLANRS